MMYIILPNLQVVFFIIYFVIKSFEKVFMRRLAMSCIIVYCTSIIPNILDKKANCIELGIVKASQDSLRLIG